MTVKERTKTWIELTQIHSSGEALSMLFIITHPTIVTLRLLGMYHLRSMAYWMLGEYRESLNTLLLTNVGHDHPSMEQNDKPRHSSEKTGRN